MATASKAFRARAFDSNKSMAIFWSQELPDLSECNAGNRAVTQMPSGMEKEEEMESHLQDAILAQQASTSGIQVNHVIPTPKVNTVDAERYNNVYLSRNKSGRNKYIKVHAWHALEKDEPEYDYDTEDEEWLNEHPHIEAKILEKVFDSVEANSSETQIASEDSISNVHKTIDASIVFEIYEYWVSKRTSAATTSGNVGVGGLIPRVRTECRKDTQGSVNPYVAFRRRAEKMQTRKNRKNDEDNYEKILKLVHDMSKARQLFEMTSKREKTKLALIDMESEILTKRMQLSDFGSSSVFNEFNEKLRAAAASTKPFSQINGTAQEESKKKKKLRKPKSTDKDLVSKAWLKKNAESWNRPPSMFGQMGSQSTAESTKPVRESFADGRYTFKRRRGCTYRAALPVVPTSHPTNTPIAPEQVPTKMRFYETILPSTNGAPKSFGFLRRRVGRGGRVMFDRLPRTEHNPHDPWAEYCVADSSRKFEAKMHPFGEEEESEEMTPTQRYFERSDRYHFDDANVEREWISTYRKDSWPEESEEMACDEKVDEDVEMVESNSADAKDDENEVERMDVDGNEDEAQITDTKDELSQNQQNHDEEATGGGAEKKVNGNGNNVTIQNHHNHNNEEDNKTEDMDVDEMLEKVRHASGGKAAPIPPKSTVSGNGLAGRVEPTPVPAKMCGTVSDSDEWREPSGSPSESNSSTEWGGFAPEQVTVAFKTKIISEDDEEPSPARPPVTEISPSIKDAISTVTTILERKNKFILPSSVGT